MATRLRKGPHLIIDMHIHTARGGPDSNLSPQELVSEARRLGLDGICLSEHGGGWDKWDFDKFAKQYPDLLLIRALEVDTEYGHIGTVGLDGYQSGIHRIHHLRKVIQECQGFMVSVHPFRRFFEKPPLNKSLLFKQPVPLEEAIEHPVFEMTDAIEAVNGACTSRENQFALKAAKLLGKPCTGGSDAHSTHGIGSGATVFERRITCQDDLLEELHAGRFYPTSGIIQGHSTPFDASDG